jgi:hypothetical protein
MVAQVVVGVKAFDSEVLALEAVPRLASPFISPLVESHDCCLGQRVEMQVVSDHRSRTLRIHVEPLGLHGEDREQIAVGMVARGRAGSAVARRPVVGACLQDARRQAAAGVSDPSASSVTWAGIFTTSQCQKPEPVGASGS